MLNERQSFLVSLAFHLGLLLVLLIGGAVVARRIMGPKPIELDLLAPVEVGPQQDPGAQQQPEEEPEISEHVVEDPIFDPNSSLDIDKIPDIDQEEFKPYDPKVEISDTGGDSSSAGTSYGALIVAACKRNWTLPGQGVLGYPVPSADAEITVARNGRIIGSRIVRSSGNAALDRSVLEAIRDANPLPAFPRELTGAQRTFTVTFIPKD